MVGNRSLKLSPSRWVFPTADGTQRAADANLKTVLRRALGRDGIVEGYEHRCGKPTCGHVERADDSSNRRCPNDGRVLWLRPLPEKGVRAGDALPALKGQRHLRRRAGLLCGRRTRLEGE